MGNRFNIIIDSLKAAFPSFEELNFPPSAAGMLTMTYGGNLHIGGPTGRR